VITMAVNASGSSQSRPIGFALGNGLSFARWRNNMTTERRTLVGLVMLISILVLGGCSQPLSTREKGTLLGGGLGAASGAIIGSAVGSPGAGAAIGGAMGALGGGLVGDQLQGQEYRQAGQQRQINRQQRELNRQRRELRRLQRRQAEEDY